MNSSDPWLSLPNLIGFALIAAIFLAPPTEQPFCQEHDGHNLRGLSIKIAGDKQYFEWKCY